MTVSTATLNDNQLKAIRQALKVLSSVFVEDATPKRSKNPHFRFETTFNTHETTAYVNGKAQRLTLENRVQQRIELTVNFLACTKVYVGITDVLQHLRQQHSSYKYTDAQHAVGRLGQLGLLQRSEISPHLFRLVSNGRKTWRVIRDRVHGKG